LVEGMSEVVAARDRPVRPRHTQALTKSSR
jgi:hypothetical protein